MAIQVSSLGKNKDFVVKGEISTESVDAYFTDLEGCHALRPLRYEAHLVNRSQYITLDVDLDTELELCCDRCGESFHRGFQSHLALKLIEASSVGDVDEIVLSEDDLDTITYQASSIELEDILLESVYLEIDDQCLCSEQCKGICMNCGKNLNLGPCACS